MAHVLSHHTSTGRSISQVPYRRLLDRYPELSEEEFLRYFHAYKAGDERSRDILVYSSLRLVFAHAWRFTDRGVAFEDLVQVSLETLVRKALPKFDPALGSFRVYATNWIKHACGRLTQRANSFTPVRMPDDAYTLRSRIRRIERDLAATRGRQPTIEELCERLLEIGALTEDELARLTPWLFGKLPSVSLNLAPEEDGDRTPLIERFNADAGTPRNPEALAGYLEIRTAVIKAISRMPPRWRDILARRYGLGVETESLREIGESYQLSHERIRQIEAEALEDLGLRLKLPPDEVSDVLEGVAPTWPCPA